MLIWTLTTLPLPLRYTWKISRNASDSKTNLLVRVANEAEHYAGWGEAAPNVRYGETPAGLEAEFARLLAAGLAHVASVADLETLLAAQEISHALCFALESAYLHREAARQGCSVAALLGVPAPVAAVPTAFSLPIMEPGVVAEFMREQNMLRFKLLKIKVNQESGYDLLREVTRVAPNHELLIDGNEAWADADSLLGFLENIGRLPGLRVRLLEQPLPAACTADYEYLRPRTPYPLFADESVTNTADFGAIARQFHGVNMKLMKAGGYRNGVQLLRQTQAHGLQTMIGCMVETSLGIWSGLQVSALASVCDLDGFLILRNEPFGLVQESEGLLTAAPQPAVFTSANDLTPE